MKDYRQVLPNLPAQVVVEATAVLSPMISSLLFDNSTNINPSDYLIMMPV